MAIQWQWKDKIGEAVVKQYIGDDIRESTKILYEGNCFLIFLNEWNENGVDKYSLYSFFADERHAKVCLGLTKEHDNMFVGGYRELVKIRINKAKSKNWKKIITLFAQAFDNIEIEIYKEEEDDNNDK